MAGLETDLDTFVLCRRTIFLETNDINTPSMPGAKLRESRIALARWRASVPESLHCLALHPMCEVWRRW